MRFEASSAMYTCRILNSLLANMPVGLTIPISEAYVLDGSPNVWMVKTFGAGCRYTLVVTRLTVVTDELQAAGVLLNKELSQDNCLPQSSPYTLEDGRILLFYEEIRVCL